MREGDQESSEGQGVIAVDGAHLRYRVEGQGIQCLILGGIDYYRRIFSPALREHFQCYFVDTRGWVPTIEPYDIQQVTIDTYADDLETVRRTLGLGKVLVMGHSIHGTLVLEYARRYPESVWGVVAIAAPAMSPSNNQEFFGQDASPSRKAALQANAARLAPEALGRLDPSAAFIESYVANGPIYWYNPRYDAAPLWAGVVLNIPQINHLFGTLYATYDLAQQLGHITAPVLLALGRYDYDVPYTQWEERKAALPQHTYVLFDKSGHTPPLEEPARFDQVLIEWAGRHAPSPL